jgi:glycosyltransferase involved in cell wall biosynthesis
MKICYILASNDDGGLETHVLDLCFELANLNQDIMLIAPAKFQKICDKRIGFHAMKFEMSRYNPLSLYKLAKTIRKNAPDIVHAHGGKAAYMLSLIHRWIPGFRVATNHGFKRKFPGYPGIQALIGVSKSILEPVEHPHKKVIYNGPQNYAGPAFDRLWCDRKWDLCNDLPLTIAAGRLVPVKGYDVLISSWKPEFGYLLLMGEGPENNRLKELIADTGSSRFVKLVGFQKHLGGLLPCADLVVFSSHREGFSYVLAEALIAGVPVVSTKVPGAIEVLPDRYLAEIGDSASLSRTIAVCLLNYRESLDQMKPVFEWARSNLSSSQMAKHTKTFYDDLVINHAKIE